MTQPTAPTRPAGDPLRVMLVDDQDVIRAGLGMILGASPRTEVVAEARDGDEVVDRALATRPDVILMDVRMPHVDGLEATRRVRAEPGLAGTAVLVLTTFAEDEYVIGALRAGAAGFLLKDTSPVELITAIQRVHAGDSLIDPAVTASVIRSALAAQPEAATRGAAAEPDEAAARALDALTERELEILDAVALGHSNREIAAALFIAESTVKTHVTALRQKLDASSRVQLVIAAYEAGRVARG